MFSRPLIFREAALLLLIFSPGTLTAIQERAYLDATQIQIRQRQREPATGGGGGVNVGYTEGKLPSAQPLTLSLKISVSGELVRGELFEYEAQIQNVGAKPIELPWDLSPADIEPADPHANYEYKTAAIYLHARLKGDHAVTMDGPILLFGSRLIPSTIINLQPGEWVRIRSKGRAVPANPNQSWPPSGFTSKQVQGTFTATLTLYANSVSSSTGDGLHEESQTLNGPITSDASTIEFRF
ncbi:MAG: hypothetical protein M3N22_05555 [Acidobacteriota bacterium]|nr:hypothetical protein [Acidobacteriota bacterium]